MPELNVIMEDFANHYGCVTIPARSGHPKDKALVEDQVQIVYRRVYAPLRNKMFHSIRELNTAIAEKMKQHNQKRMQRLLSPGRNGSCHGQAKTPGAAGKGL